MIRPLAEADAPRFAELAGQLGYPVSLDEVLPRLRRELGRSDAVTLVYQTADGSLVGWIALVEVHRTYRSPYGEVVGLVIDAASRSRGYGAELLAAGEDWVRSRGLAEVRVRSNVVREAAHRFYLREGYEAAKTQAVFQKRRLL